MTGTEILQFALGGVFVGWIFGAVLRVCIEFVASAIN